MGYAVTVFEAFHVAGGVLQYGIPEFRLPKKLVNAEIEGLSKLGVKIEKNVVIGKTFTLEDLKEMGYRAIFIGTGAGLPSFMHIPGENLNGVYSANEFLTRINLMKAYKFPEFDTPIKCAFVRSPSWAAATWRWTPRGVRSGWAQRACISYTAAGEEEMPARKEEVHHAKEEGIDFRLLQNPVEILGDAKGSVTGIKNIKMELGAPDASGRRRPVEMPGSEYVIDVDAVVIAIGQSPNPLIKNATPALKTQPWGGIVAGRQVGPDEHGGRVRGRGRRDGRGHRDIGDGRGAKTRPTR